MAKFRDISIEEWKKLSEEEQKNFKEVIKKTFLGMNKVSMENKTEAARSEKRKKEALKKNFDVMSGIWKQSKITSTAVKVVTSNWGKILGLAIFLLPKKFWVGLKDSLFRLYNFFKGGKWKNWKEHIGKIGIGLGLLALYFAPKSAFMVGMAAFNALVIGFKGLKWAGGKIVSTVKTRNINKAHVEALEQNKEFDAKKTAKKTVSAIPENDMTVAKKGKVSWWKKLVKEIDGKVIKAAKFSVRGLKMVPIVGSILGTIVESVIAIITGDKMAEEWGVGKDSAIVGALLGGGGEPGGWNIAGQMLTYGTLGFAAGGPVGLAVGIVMGAVMGIIGGKKMAQAFENLSIKVETMWIKWIQTPFELFMTDVDHYMIKPMNEFFEPFGKWIDEKMSPIIKGFKNWYTGIQKWIDGLNFIKTISDLVGGTAEENERKLEIARKQKEDAEKEKERKLQADKEIKLQEEIETQQKIIAKEKARIQRSKDSKDESGGIMGTFFGSRGDGGEYFGTNEAEGRKGSAAKIRAAEAKLKKLGGAPAKPTGSKATPIVSSGKEAHDLDTPEPRQPQSIPTKRWTKVGIDSNVSDKGMLGTHWDQLGGYPKIERAILKVWNEHGIDKAPTFTSGLRTVDGNKDAGTGGVKKSQHLKGTAFDLRNRMIPIPQRDAVASALQGALGSGMKVIRHKELDSTYPHFHIQMAAQGYHGFVSKPTGFIAGEAGTERVDITPLNGPTAKMASFNNLQNQNLDAQRMGGSGGGTTVIAPQTTKVSQSSTTAVMSNPTAKDTFWLDA